MSYCIYIMLIEIKYLFYNILITIITIITFTNNTFIYWYHTIQYTIILFQAPSIASSTLDPSVLAELENLSVSPPELK